MSKNEPDFWGENNCQNCQNCQILPISTKSGTNRADIQDNYCIWGE